MPKDLPLLFLAGDADPVGEQGKGVRRAIQSLKDAGVQNIECKLYPGARHELLVETNKQEVFADIGNWLDRQLTCTHIPKPLHRVLCGGFFFSPVSGRVAPFTDISHFVLSVVLQQHRLKPSQQHHSTVSALFHYRFKSVSNRSAQISIFYHFPVFLCYLLGLYSYFLGIPSNFQRFFKRSPSC